MEVKEKIKMLQEKMKEERIDYYLIPTADYHNSEYVNDYFKVREYFSGFTGSNGTLLVSGKGTERKRHYTVSDAGRGCADDSGVSCTTYAGKRGTWF